jgi:osmotically-inducible protein OsmY
LEAKVKNLLPTAALVTAISLTGPLAFADSDFQGGAKDAWITGKIETVYTLNPHLSPFRIDTDVNNGVVVLSGTVESDIDRDLAGELAKGIAGVTEVNNELQVDADNARHADAAAAEATVERRDFGTWVDDATTTAAVKSKLIQNANTKGLKIDVDTNDDVVTLSGRAETAQAKELAGELARNTGDVKAVHNNLVVDAS